jgi:hypothetical protein
LNVSDLLIRAAHPVDARGIQRLGGAVFVREWDNYFPGGAHHLEAADAAGRSASYYWTTPTDREYSVWAWRALDPERPVTAWAADPEHRQPGLQDVGRIAAELERQESFGLGRVPADLRALAARAKDSGGSQDQPPRARW